MAPKMECQKISAKKKFIIQMHTWSPALADRDTAFAFVFPESLPALPPAWDKKIIFLLKTSKKFSF